MMPTAFLVPIALQAAIMLVDELWFHRRRGLPRWERIGHPLDTLTIVVCLAWLLAVEPDAGYALPVYVGLAIASCVFVTKDEAIHAAHCTAGEHWLHSLLFVLHPIVLAVFALLWWRGHAMLLGGQLAVTVAFMTYQYLYWRRAPESRAINNDWYSDLGARWYGAEDTPIALLRAEARHRNPWIADELARAFDGKPCRVLDLGCGAGFLANYLATQGHHVVGLDASRESIDIARAHDASGTVRFVRGDVRALPFVDGSFDVVCAMDLLEHVDAPGDVIAEVGRVLAPSGTFFFHTFNRTWQSHLIVIKGVEWFVKNTPKDLHVIDLFITPEELTGFLERSALEPVVVHGSRPRFRWPLWRMLLTGRVGNDVAFTFTPSTKLGYTGFARKRGGVRRVRESAAVPYEPPGTCP